MKMRSFFLVILFLGAITLFGIFLMGWPKKDATSIFAEEQDSKLGNLYVVGRYDGFPNGWNIAFFHKDTAGKFWGYYLAHESLRWDPRIEIDNGKVLIWERNKKAAEYDPSTGTFRHHFQGTTYSKLHAIEGMGPNWWGLH